MLPGSRAPWAERARRGARLRRHELDAGGRARGGEAERPRGARRGRPALLRPDDARGAEPPARRPRLRAPLLPVRRGGREPRRGGDQRGRARGRRRHVRRQPAARAHRPRSLQGARDGRRRARPLPRAHPAPAGQYGAGGTGPHRRGASARSRSRSSSPPIPGRPRPSTGAGISLDSDVQVLPPAGYLDFAALASQARLVLTDSGGVQKEAYWYGVPCITLRTTSEWVETVETGWNRLVGTDPDLIVSAVQGARPRRKARSLRRRPRGRENR